LNSSRLGVRRRFGRLRHHGSHTQEPAPSIKHARSPNRFPGAAPFRNCVTGLDLLIENSAFNALIVTSGYGQYSKSARRIPQIPFGPNRQRIPENLNLPKLLDVRSIT
jgi:hypothetical protein